MVISWLFRLKEIRSLRATQHGGYYGFSRKDHWKARDEVLAWIDDLLGGCLDGCCSSADRYNSGDREGSLRAGCSGRQFDGAQRGDRADPHDDNGRRWLLCSSGASDWWLYHPGRT